MTVTARKMQMGARSITTGKQLLGQGHGPATHVGPNAILRSSSYPAVTAAPGTGPLRNPALPSGNYFQLNGATEFAATVSDAHAGLACDNWASGPTTVYQYNNNPSNHGGTVPAGGMIVDGFPVPAGAEVFQFLDLSAAGVVEAELGAGSVVFRGCRWRAHTDGSAHGFIAVDSNYTLPVTVLYCDFGGNGTSNTQYSNDSLQNFATTALVLYRNYFSLHGTAVQPNGASPPSSGPCDILENYMENWVYFSPDHDNGISASGNGWSCFRWQRNYVVCEAVDANSAQIQQTDCISIGSDGSVNNIGTGTNPDGTVGFQIKNNYCAGTGYCYYLASSGTLTVSGLNFTGNLVSTSSWAIGSGGTPFLGGGYAGPYTDAPSWTGTNTKSGNLWADGASVRTAFI
jgi:hypothetical protein